MSGFFGRVLGGGGGGGSPGSSHGSSKSDLSTRNMIDRLVISLNTSSMLTDRRASLRALLSIVRDYPSEVGSVALTSILAALEGDSDDPETSEYAIGILRVLCSSSPTDESIRLSDDQRLAFCELVLKIGHVKTCFDTLRLLGGLQETIPERLQQAIMTCPGGITLFMDLLRERELVRNAKDSDDLQKIMAFEGCFEHLFSILESEGEEAADSFAITDSLNLVRVLLAYNPSNQKYFCEGPCLGRLRMFLERCNLASSTATDIGSHLEDALQIVSLFLSRSSQRLAGMQNVLVNHGFFKVLLEIINNPDTTSPVAARAFDALASLVWKNRKMQESLGPLTVTVGDNSTTSYPIPFLLAIIWRAVYGSRFGGSGDLRLFAERLAAAQLVEAYLKDYPDGQISIGALLTPPPPALEDNNHGGGVMAVGRASETYSAGSVLVTGLLDLDVNRKDPYLSWFAAYLFSLVLADCLICKKIALGHHIRTNNSDRDHRGDVDKLGGDYDVEEEEEGGQLLIEQLSQRILEASRDRHLARPMIGYLILLIAWLENFPGGVEKYVEESGRVQMLLELLSLSGLDPGVQGLAGMVVGLLCISAEEKMSTGSVGTGEIRAIIRDRIGVDLFAGRISRLREFCMSSRSASLDPANPNTFPMIPAYLVEKILHTPILDAIGKSISARPSDIPAKPSPEPEVVSMLRRRIEQLEVELAARDSHIRQLEDGHRRGSVELDTRCAMLMDSLMSLEAENSLLLETITRYERYLLSCNVDLNSLQDEDGKMPDPSLSAFPPTNHNAPIYEQPADYAQQPPVEHEARETFSFDPVATINGVEQVDAADFFATIGDTSNEPLVSENPPVRDDFFDQLAASATVQHELDVFNAPNPQTLTEPSFELFAPTIPPPPPNMNNYLSETQRKADTTKATYSIPAPSPPALPSFINTATFMQQINLDKPVTSPVIAVMTQNALTNQVGSNVPPPPIIPYGSNGNSSSSSSSTSTLYCPSTISGAVDV